MKTLKHWWTSDPVSFSLTLNITWWSLWIPWEYIEHSGACLFPFLVNMLPFFYIDEYPTLWWSPWNYVYMFYPFSLLHALVPVNFKRALATDNSCLAILHITHMFPILLWRCLDLTLMVLDTTCFYMRIWICKISFKY